MQNWIVLFVKPRTEKKVTEYCKLYGIPSYLPLREKTRVMQRRKVTFMIPVFPGYVFAKVTPDLRLELLKTNLLVRTLEPLQPRRMLRDLIMVRRALRVNPTLQTAKPLAKGRLVRIISGPFMGIEGRVSRVSEKMQVILSIDLIGQAVSASVQTDQIELL